LRSKITIVHSTKKPDKWKKYSVSISVLTTVFEKMCPHLIWNFLSYLGWKKGISETLLSLCLFFSWLTASASKMQPWLQKPLMPFFYLGNLTNFSFTLGQFFLAICLDNYDNKILFLRDEYHAKEGFFFFSGLHWNFMLFKILANTYLISLLTKHWIILIRSMYVELRNSPNIELIWSGVCMRNWRINVCKYSVKLWHSYWSGPSLNNQGVL